MSEANRDLPLGESAIVTTLEAIYEVLTEIRDAVRATNWTCGCGHVNGTNLIACAVCGRRPGEKL